jgi:transcriptional regulator with XRE-family HTH domain
MSNGEAMLVQKLRLQRGWSQEQLAELSGLSVRTIQRIERGSNASIESLKALGAVFEIDFSNLRESDMAADRGLTGNATQEEALAFARVRRLRGFYLHVAQYVVIIAFLTIVNLVVSRHYFWVGWVILGWGVGLLLHGLRVFEKIPFLTADWEKRQVERYLGRKL